MTRVACPRATRKKTEILNEDDEEESKENNPPLIRRQVKKIPLVNKQSSLYEDNMYTTRSKTSKLTTTSKCSTNMLSPIRKAKSVWQVKSAKDLKKHVKINSDRSVLCDKTNKQKSNSQQSIDSGIASLAESLDVPLLRTTENKNKLVHQVISLPILNSSDRNKSKLPVYKTTEARSEGMKKDILSVENKEAVYEFEVDENEEPVKKKKLKKKVYAKKPNIGPKALTINNIKYSSTESLVSLPEKPIARKKKPSKLNTSKLKSYSSISSLTTTDDNSSSSINKLMLHPPSLKSRGNKVIAKSKKELSILMESQSEQMVSPLQPSFVKEHMTQLTDNLRVPVIQTVGIRSDQSSVPQSSNISILQSDGSLPQSAGCSQMSAPPINLQRIESRIDSQSGSANCSYGFASPTNPQRFESRVDSQSGSARCSLFLSPTNRQRFESSITRYPEQASVDLANVSYVSSHDFLSSTPCKRVSAVVCHNSVFDNSLDVPNNVFTPAKNSLDNCFGFDEFEEVEEPLVSPIKKTVKKMYIKMPTQPKSDKLADIDRPKPSTQEVIELLKASIPKKKRKEAESEVYNIEEVGNPLSQNDDNASDNENIKTNFNKPPRRSYERQRRVRYKSESEEEENYDIENKIVEEKAKEHVKADVKKCYKRSNRTKTAKPQKVTKGKQKANKEEEELERLAAMMNAQFQKIEQVSLIVE